MESAGKRLLSRGVAALAVALVGACPAPAQHFALDFSRQSLEITCPVQAPATTRVYCRLDSTRSAEGAEGWAIGVRAPGHRIAGITLQGTGVEWALQRGSVVNEITTGEGNEGAVSFVTLSVGDPVALPLSPDRDLFAIDVEANAGEPIRLEYDGDLESSLGRPGNEIRTRSGVYAASTVSRSTLPGGVPSLGFSMAAMDSAVPFEGIAGGVSAAGAVVIEGDPDVSAKTHAYACIVSEAGLYGTGVFGWSLSIALDGEASLVSATTDGMASDRYLGEGFNKTSIIDPSRNDGQRGIVSSIVYAGIVELTLPVAGTRAALDIGLAADRSACGGACAARLRFQDGLMGVGQPVHNTLTIGGAAFIPCNLPTASVDLLWTHGRQPFVRGNANGDARLDISDPAFLLNELFYGGVPSRCREAEDTNDDGRVDISDAIFAFGYLFLGTKAPPAPFPTCALNADDDPTELGCLEAQVACD